MHGAAGIAHALEPGPFRIRVQDSAELEAGRFELLAWEDPCAVDGPASPFWRHDGPISEHSGVWTGTILDLKHPTQSYIRCSGSLGWGLQAAPGAKCAAPDRPVLCFTGDGGIWYHIAEIETAIRENLYVVILVNNNHSLNQEKNGVESYEGRSAASDKQWLFPDSDFAAIAESMGAMELTVDKPGDLAGALDKSFSAKRPVVVDVKSHVDSIAPLAWLP